ncbi:MAG: CHAT domain-containing protein [Cyclobacteriaceae bacterium]|nr:CHAT domain-containing protein [Cyclobacteriaceae bacterium SS2]
MRLTKLLFLLTFLMFMGVQSRSQSWEVLFEKPEKMYTKGKYHKVASKLKKFRKKTIPKVYSNDSSMYALANIMEARALEAQHDYPAMNSLVKKATRQLDQTKANNGFAYSIGMLKLVDLYNDYGSYRTADSLLTQLKDYKVAYESSEVLKKEIEIREVITDIYNGFYLESEPRIQDLVKTWQPLMNQGYLGEKVDNLDQIYRNELLARLYVAEINLATWRGEYSKAFELHDKHKSFFNKMSSTSPAYFKYRLAEIEITFETGDLNKARRLNSNYTYGKLIGKYKEIGIENDIKIEARVGKPDNAKSAVLQLSKYAGKIRMNKKFENFKRSYYEAFIKIHENDLRGGLLEIGKIDNETPNTVVPLDHSLRTDLAEFTINTSIDSRKFIYQRSAEDYYIKLGRRINARYVDGSLFNKLYQVSLAGYYLNYTETPNKAYEIFDQEPEEMVFEQLKATQWRFAKAVTDMTEYLVLEGDYLYGVDLLQEVVDGMRANEYTDQTKLGDKMVSLARMQTYAGDYKTAEINTDEALKLIRRDGEKRSYEYVNALNSAALIYGTMGIYNKAERLLSKGESISSKLIGGDREIRLQSIEDLAFLYTRIGNYSETEVLLKEVIEARKKIYGANSRKLIKAYNALGELYMIRGEYPEAEKNIRTSLDICKTVYGENSLIYANNLVALVDFYKEIGNYQAGLQQLDNIFKIRTQKLQQGHILFSEVYRDYGLLHYHLGSNLNRVEQYFQQAREIVQTTFDQNHPSYAEAIKNLGFLYAERGEYDRALPLLTQADEIWTNALGNKNRSSGEVARLKGDIYTDQEKFELAETEYEKSSKYFRKIFSKQHPDYLNALSKLAQVYYINGELDKVESILSETTLAYLEYTRIYFPTLSEEEKANFWAKIKKDFEFYNTVAVDFQYNKPKYLENMYDFALATKSLLLNSSIKTRNAILNSGDTTLISLFEEWLEQKEFLTSTLSRSDEELVEDGININDIKDDISRLEKELSEKSTDFAQTFENEVYSWNDVRKVLKDNEAAVEIIRYRQFDKEFNEEKVRYAALIVTAETKKNPTLVLLENGNDLENKFFTLQRNSVKFKLEDKLSYLNYWRPIATAIGNKDVVYVSPDGIYNQINIEALMMDDGNFVIDKQNIRIVNSTKALPINRSKEAKKAQKNTQTELNAMLFGNPEYYTNDKEAVSEATGPNKKVIPQLPGTEREVTIISDLLKNQGWKANTYIGTEASEEAIKKADNYKLLHIATHGFFDEEEKKVTDRFSLFEEDNPLERSGLLAKGGGDVLLEASDKNYNMNDGILTAYEAMNLNFDNTELIVLSACETGRGEIKQGEGVFGLQRSFLVAGADAMIMSLFQVSDEVTEKLMTEFYKNWIEQKKEKREAFNLAQKAVKAEFKDPIYWGAFIMIAKS